MNPSTRHGDRRRTPGHTLRNILSREAHEAVISRDGPAGRYSIVKLTPKSFGATKNIRGTFNAIKARRKKKVQGSDGAGPASAGAPPDLSCPCRTAACGEDLIVAQWATHAFKRSRGIPCNHNLSSACQTSKPAACGTRVCWGAGRIMEGRRTNDLSRAIL